MTQQHERIELIKGSHENIVAGDLIEIKRKGYAHWAVYMGDKYVVHLTGDMDESPKTLWGKVCALWKRNVFYQVRDKQFEKCYIRKELLWNVVRTDDRAFRNNKNDREFTPFKSAEVAQRAHRFMVEVENEPVYYNAIYANCEHFVNFCRYNIFYSQQASVKKYILPTVGGFTSGIFLGNLRLAYLVKHIRG